MSKAQFGNTPIVLTDPALHGCCSETHAVQVIDPLCTAGHTQAKANWCNCWLVLLVLTWFYVHCPACCCDGGKPGAGPEPPGGLGWAGCNTARPAAGAVRQGVQGNHAAGERAGRVGQCSSWKPCMSTHAAGQTCTAHHRRTAAARGPHYWLQAGPGANQARAAGAPATYVNAPMGLQRL